MSTVTKPELDWWTVDPDGNEIQHLYARRPGPGVRAFCGHVWTPDEAARLAHGEEPPICPRCKEFADERAIADLQRKQRGG